MRSEIVYYNNGDFMKKKIVYGCLMVVWMIVIFCFSAQVADQSQQTSDGILIKLFEFISISLKDYPSLWDTLSYMIRKAAHMSEYAVLSILCTLYIKECSAKHPLWMGWLMASFYACTDEFHQLFVAGRSGEVKDVMIDACGAIIGILFLLICSGIRKRRDKKRGMSIGCE